MQIPSVTSHGSSFLITDSSYYDDNGLTEASREIFTNKQALDPLFCYDFQSYNLPMTNYHTSLKPCDQSQFGLNSSYGFT